MQIDEDMKHEILKWKVEKAGKLIMLLILILSILGVLGPGLFSEQKASDKDLRIEYNYFEHSQSPGQYKILVDNLSENSSSYTLSLNADLINYLDIKSIIPSPDQSYVSEGKINYKFIKGPKVKRMEIIIHYEGLVIGFNPVKVGDGQASISFNQFFYP